MPATKRARSPPPPPPPPHPPPCADASRTASSDGATSSEASTSRDGEPRWTSALLAVSGSVAAVKAPELAEALLRRGVSVDVVLTEAAYALLQASYRGTKPWDALQALARAFAPEGGSGSGDSGGGGGGDGGGDSCGGAAAEAEADRCRVSLLRPVLRIYRDADEWRDYTAVGADPVLHIELAKRNKLLLIAPLCANTLAAAALGLCHNLLGSVLRAWYYDLDPAFAAPLAERYGAHAVNRPVLVAPAMNTFMWHQRVTASHLATLEARGVRLIDPIRKTLACGDTGLGAMAEVPTVVTAALALLSEHAAAERAADAAGKPVFVP